jgi:glycosyltransferase involved in cell wall biosynthesis
MPLRPDKVIVAYSGVHQAFQIALAAQEAGLLDCFYCSLLDAQGKWGGRLRRVLGADAMSNRQLAGLDPNRVVEHPWPELHFKLRSRFVSAAPNGWIYAAHQLDRWVSDQIRRSSSRVFVGVENCAYHSFQAAQAQGMKRVYDCPGYNARHTQNCAEETARRFGLRAVVVGDTPEMERRKEVEIGLADYVLCYSDIHAASLRPWGVTPEKAVINPLWIDPNFWFPSPGVRESEGKLRVLYAGGINLRKGIPFLIEAARQLRKNTALTLVGKASEDVRPVIAGASEWLTLSPPVSKPALRRIYARNDVLVLPSLGDSFGFVALEAMACGLPVIVSENCGVPVPDPSWRVPIMDSNAIANRLQLYADNRDLLRADGERAAVFACGYTPERYRAGIRQLLERIV